MKTPTDIIQALGGEVALASALGFRYRSRVSNWRTTGIPRQHWPEILDLAKSREAEVTFDTLRASESAL